MLTANRIGLINAVFVLVGLVHKYPVRQHKRRRKGESVVFSLPDCRWGHCLAFQGRERCWDKGTSGSQLFQYGPSISRMAREM
jgi:hypothetical protein